MKGFIFGFAFVVSVSGQGTLVVPNGLESVEGNSRVVPLFGGGENSRTQMIYGSQHFGLFSSEGAYITELRFRMDGDFSSTFVGSADLEIRLSTSSLPPDGLFSDLSRNVGPDVTIAFPRSTIQIIETPGSGGGPNSFSAVFPLPNRFYFNPADGNLLVDATVYSYSNVAHFDWENSPNDAASTAVRPLGVGNTTLSSIVPVMQIGFEPVPEPDVVGMLALIAVIAGYRKIYVSPRCIN